jgi:hypothetical protein
MCPERSRDNALVTPDDFIAAVHAVVYTAAVNGTLTNLNEPPGRAPGDRALALQEWYEALTAEDQRMVAEVVRDAAHAAVFGFFCVLDGVVAIDDPPHAELRLVAVSPGGEESVLNDPSVDLHDSFNGLVHPPSERWPTSSSD